MKKNIMLRLSAVLLVAVLLTTCVISGTWAKYVSTGSVAETARVAKWGVVLTAEAVAQDQLEVDFSTEEDSVYAEADLDLVAPGTAVKFASISVSGKPEVAVEVAYTADLTLTGWAISTGDYVPLIFVINGVHYSYEGMGATSAADFEQKIESKIAENKAQYDENKDLVDAIDLAVSCYWAFEGENAKDTELGNLATAPKVSLKITATVTQID